MAHQLFMGTFREDGCAIYEISLQEAEERYAIVGSFFVVVPAFIRHDESEDEPGDDNE